MRSNNPFDELGRQLGSVASRRSGVPRTASSRVGRRHSRRPAVAALAISGVVAAVALASGIGDGDVNPVAAAAAVLEPNGQVVHLVLDGGPVQPNGDPADSVLRLRNTSDDMRLDRRIEQWSTADPLQFRSTQKVLRSNGETLGTYENGVTSDGTVWSDMSWDDRPASTQPMKDAAPLGDGAAVGALQGPDPVQQIRSGLESGRFRVDGKVSLNGGDVLRMVAKDGAANTRKWEYLVDAKTYAPRELRTYDRGQLTDVLKVTAYETRSLDSSTAAVFRVTGR